MKISIHTRQIPDASLVEKSVGGVKHRYMCGIASGTRKDQHGERLTQHCIDSIMDQCKKGDILLYADKHGVKASEDIGILTDFHVDDNGDWIVEFRLYDQTDGVDTASLEVADKLWKQLNGLPPYRKPRRKGFSIEGYVPDENGLVDKKEKFKIIDDIVLEGVVVVPEPAYQDSVIHSVYKALGETPEWSRRKTIREILLDGEDPLDINPDALQCVLRDVLRDTCINNESSPEDLEVELRSVLGEYTDLMVEWIKSNTAFFMQGFQTDKVNPYSASQSSDKIIANLKIEISKWAKLQGVAK